jgi:hypothetical protein
MAAASLGRLAYAAYAVSTGGKTWDGRTMPSWDGLGDAIRAAWDRAADAVVQDFCGTAPHGRCGECFEPMVPMASRPGLSMCPTHRPEWV